MKLPSISKKAVFAKATPDKSIAIPHSAFRTPHSQGFTLIEILVVVVVILLLSGMLYKIGNLVDARAKKAETVARMQKIANALEEYNGVYGTYPNPKHDYAITVVPIANSLGEVIGSARNLLNLGYERRDELDLKIGENFGLVSFLCLKDMPFYDKDLEDPKKDHPRKPEFISWDQKDPPPKTPDKNTRGRWSEFIDDVSVGKPENPPPEYIEVPISGVNVPIQRTIMTFKDAWNGDLVYVSKFPNLSYSLVSKGPDHTLDTEDDVSVASSGQ